MHAKHIPNETYEEWRRRSDELNASAQTDPPSQRIDCTDYVDYPGGTYVQWVCSCGNRVLNVYYEEGSYRTFVCCPDCHKSADVHTG